MAIAALQLSPKTPIQQWFGQLPIWLFAIAVGLTAFTAYSCMYGFRKPYTAASFTNYYLFGISYKVVLIIAQVIGYTISKFLGIYVIAILQPTKRGIAILLLMLLAWASLLLFAIIPFPYNFICLFINGLPLGMIWGLIFGFIEGRKQTEMMAALMGTSFIFASGLAKTVGKWLMLTFKISEWWMPFAAGCLFIVPLVVCVFVLEQLPEPSQQDVQLRTVRQPMDNKQQKEFLKKFGFALIPVVATYLLLTILRDFSEDFSNELWIETGYQNNAAIFTQTGSLISIIVLAITGSFFLIKNNFKAFKLNHWLVVGGFTLTIVSTIMYHLQVLHVMAWFVAATMGLYIGFVTFNCLYFERMIASYKIVGNVGFVMYIADSFGYLGTIIVLLLKEFISIKYHWVSFYTYMFYSFSIAGIFFVFIALYLFEKIYIKYEHE